MEGTRLTHTDQGGAKRKPTVHLRSRDRDKHPNFCTLHPANSVQFPERLSVHLKAARTTRELGGAAMSPTLQKKLEEKQQRAGRADKQ